MYNLNLEIFPSIICRYEIILHKIFMYKLFQKKKKKSKMKGKKIIIINLFALVIKFFHLLLPLFFSPFPYLFLKNKI